jgi:hypothetical protein
MPNNLFVPSVEEIAHLNNKNYYFFGSLLFVIVEKVIKYFL